jgi:hypothetical protein
MNPAIPEGFDVTEVSDIADSLGMVDAFGMESTPQEGERYG